MNRVCKFCGNSFFEPNGRIFSNHVKWCKSNPKRNDQNENIRKGHVITANTRFGKYELFDRICEKCHQPFQVRTRSKNKKRNKRFCSRSCANTHVFTDTRCDSISLGIRKYLVESGWTPKELHPCVFCQNETQNKTFCSTKCGHEYRKSEYRKQESSLRQYRVLAKFQFGVSDYPNEFDFYLVRQYGWYAPVNRGNNLGGVSRDHKVSIRYGFDNKIDPNFIGHPANCRLLRHNENSVKNVGCSITFEQLKSDIRSWEARYPSQDFQI